MSPTLELGRARSFRTDKIARLLWAVRLVVGIGSGLLIAAAIAIAPTVPAPACNELASATHVGSEHRRMFECAMTRLL